MSDSSITKKAIARGFKELLKIKKFEKITISEITNHCGLNRQTFYYHFQDKYDLINWIFYEEAINVIKNELTIENWDEKVFELLSMMKNDQSFYQTTLKDVEGTEFHNYLFSVTKDIFLEMIDHLGDTTKTLNETIDGQKKLLIAEFLSYGVVGMIIAWARNGMRQSPDEITKNIRDIISEARLFAVSRYFTEMVNN